MPPRRALTPHRLKELQDAFKMFDKDGSGSIDAQELQQVLRSMGRHPNPMELEEIMERMDADKNGVIDFAEFTEAMAGQEADEELAAELAEVAGVFAIFDTDGSGQLSASELQRALRILGVQLSHAEVELLMKEVDADGDLQISCDELLGYLMRMDDGDDAPVAAQPQRQQQQHEKEQQQAEADLEAGGGGVAGGGAADGDGAR